MTITAGETRTWYRIEGKSDSAATLYIFDEINPMWGIAAQQVVDELKTIKASELNVHINSPGGNVFDGIAIMNAIRQHPAKVTVTVDGLAASIASVVAMAGDQIIMSLGSQMMVHNPSGIAVGDARTMRELADTLDKSRASIAAVYADRAGGTVEDWQAAMDAETWYTAQEAVDAGLADKIDDSSQAEDIAAKFDLSIFNHAGRAAAPMPYMPPKPPKKQPVTAIEAVRRIHNAPVKGSISNQEGSDMSDSLIQGMRERLGLPAGASEAEILAAFDQRNSTTTPEPAPQPDPDPTPDPSPAPAPDPQPAPPQGVGTMTIDASAWDAMQERTRKLEAEAAKRAREERDQVIAQAIQDGKFAPARKEHWARLWDADPEGTRTVINGLTKNVIPVDAIGFGVEDEESIDAEFAHLFGPKGA